MEAFAFSNDGHRVAYWQRGRGSMPVWELWVANADYSAPMQLPAIMAVSIAMFPPVWSLNDSLIAATTSQFGGTDIVVVPSSGGGARRITTEPGIEAPIAWHADGRHLDYVAFVSGGRWAGYIASVDSGTSVPSVPSEQRSYLSFTSPDGRRIAFQVTDGAKQTIWVADRDGRNARQLTTEGFESLEDPFDGATRPWSPDGKSLAYESRRTGRSDVWVVSVDSGARRQLTRDIASDFWPAWSPDGRWIAFRSNRGRQTDIWIVPAAGGPETRITDTPSWELRPAWIANGTLAFRDDRSLTSVWSIDVTSGTERRISPDTALFSASAPSLSPDGRTLSYMLSGTSGISDIVVTSVDGGEQRRVIELTSTVNGAVLSPDASRLAFASYSGKSSDIWVMDVASRAMRRVTDWPGAESDPSWSPDGKYIYFLSNREARGYDIWRIPADSGGTATRLTRSGGFNGMGADPRLNAIMANVRSATTGLWSLAVVGWDGSMRTIWDSTASYYASISPSGDSMAAVVQMPDGHQESRILSTKTGGGRAILNRDEYAGAWSNNGRWLLYNYAERGVGRLGVLDLSNGTTRRLPTSAGYDDAAYGAVWTHDDRAVIFERRKPDSRVYTVDVSRPTHANH
jgi:Tol biopolymer transport system component